ncbi:enoyl-CoA hydratase EchA19-like isoform X2 [Paramacrobiotus metropolitanus]|uniref:enoyl-CoA hydratase EchA19-like isoform X2 n=1 Tax=Paramacrobiotus metropolitanus TaxID=2943436 RepID=UPI0024461AA2|nr:enoyl-CoA hydratase EchA19-like isoform X2 [Paramacrobiotus metropolitanus]
MSTSQWTTLPNVDGIPENTKLLEAVVDFEKDKDARVAVIYGKDGCFCSGWDLDSLFGEDEKGAMNMSKLPGLLGPPRRNLISKPMIAAVNGLAVAGGLELALLCDMRVAEEDAVFGVYSKKYGVPLVGGGTVRLPALIGVSRAVDLILTGRGVSGQEALQMGLANRIVDRGTAVGEAVKMATLIAKYPQEYMLADRKSVYYATYNAKTHDDALLFEHDNGKEIIAKGSEGSPGFPSGAGSEDNGSDAKKKGKKPGTFHRL